MGVSGVGSKVVGFVAVDKPLSDTVYHAADHGRGDLRFSYRRSRSTETASVVTSLLLLHLKI